MTFRLTVRVNPSTSRRRAVWKEQFLKVNLRSPAEEERANRELVEYVAELFGIRPGDVSLARGRHSRRKVLELSNLDRAKLRRTIRSLQPGSD